MYVKPPRRQIHGVYVPDNYNGTIFTDTPEPPVNDQGSEEAIEQSAQVSPAPESVPASKNEEKGLLSSLFSGFGGLRSDDLLLLALILLMSRSDGSDSKHGTSEILPLLALLLFMG